MLQTCGIQDTTVASVSSYLSDYFFLGGLLLFSSKSWCSTRLCSQLMLFLHSAKKYLSSGYMSMSTACWLSVYFWLIPCSVLQAPLPSSSWLITVSGRYGVKLEGGKKKGGQIFPLPPLLPAELQASDPMGHASRQFLLWF